MGKLYFHDCYIYNFEANVLDSRPYEDKYAIILDETAFFPEGGGQPSDTGYINDIPVLHVIEENNQILHITPVQVNSQRVNCRIDWDRRFDNMQQHTGQHILSACFYKLYNGNTSSFHIGIDSTTIEIDIKNFNHDDLDAIEKLANSIIYKNIPVISKFYEVEELKNIPLRKQPKVEDNIRIVYVQDFDWSPCGGTHVSNTGEIGIIKIKRWEKLKESYKFDFVCGYRALKDYNIKNCMINNFVARFSTPEYDIENAVKKLDTDYNTIQKQLSNTKLQLTKYEAKELLRNCKRINNVNLIYKVFDEKDINEIKLLAQNIIQNPSSIVLLASKNNNIQVIFSRSDDINTDMGSLLKSLITIIDGKGGGNPKSAQGGGSKLEAIDDLIDKAIQLIETELSN